MKLTIVDSGDWSVGIHSASFEIECPFNADEDKEIREEFREFMTNAYQVYCEGRLTAIYDDEWSDL